MGPQGDADSRMRPMLTQGRAYWREMELTCPIVNAILNTDVENVIGADGIQIMPQIKTKSGKLHKEANASLSHWWKEWSKTADVSRKEKWPGIERMCFRMARREGECFVRKLVGNVKNLEHGIPELPFSIEVIESEMIDESYDKPKSGIHCGIKQNQWGAAEAYYKSRVHPGSSYDYSATTKRPKRIPASEMIHYVAVRRRPNQTRGISPFSGTEHIIYQMQDMIEAEIVAGRASAKLWMALIRKEGYQEFLDNNPDFEEGGFHMTDDGMVIDAGEWVEKLEVASHNRPNNKIDEFAQGRLKEIASSLQVSYATISRDYGSTFSAQRQQLIEAFQAYMLKRNEFVCSFLEPIREEFVRIWWAQVEALNAKCDEKWNINSVDPKTLQHAKYSGPKMPWIDPVKEAKAMQARIDAKVSSVGQEIRNNGDDPQEVYAEIQQEQQLEIFNAKDTTEDASDTDNGVSSSTDSTEAIAA